MAWPTKVLMVSPEHFTVDYAINPHMLDENGQLNNVDQAKAREQWDKLYATFEALHLQVKIIDGVAGFPDMVFCANHIFPFQKNGETEIVLSQMQSAQRQGEVATFNEWAKSQSLKTHKLSVGPFEGMGDALWDYDSGQVFAGFGFRTQPEVYAELENIIGQKIITFELKDERFYHLDTCLALLGHGQAAYVAEAFTPEGLATLKQSFTTLISVPLDEATKQLACNMCTPNGKDVIIQSGAKKTVDSLKELGFNVIEVETSEFIKSGGSVFCMKMLLP